MTPSVPRMLKLIETMRADRIVSEAGARRNACAGGAIAATIAACSTLGATRGLTLAHTTSSEVIPGQNDDAVGYAAVVFA